MANTTLIIPLANLTSAGLIYADPNQSGLVTNSIGTFVNANTGLIVNSYGVFVGNYQTSAGLSTNVATLTANNTYYVGSVPAIDVVSDAQLSGNLANYPNMTQLTNNLANYQTSSGLNANIAAYLPSSANVLPVFSSSQNGAVQSSGGGTLNYLRADGSWTQPAGIAGNPAGVNTQIQFNQSNSFGGDANLTWNNSTVTIGLGTGSINSISYSGTANNSLYIGGLIASNVVSNAQLSANLANYPTNTQFQANLGNYQTTSQIATNYTNTTQLAANLVVVGLNLTNNLANYQTTAGLAANVAVLPANNALYLGGVAAASYPNTSQLTNNLANYPTNTQFQANLGNYQTTAGLSANVAKLASNNALYLGGVAAASYQTTAGLSTNVATLIANNTSYVGSVSAANVVSNAQLSANLANYPTNTQFQANLGNYQTTAGLNANIAAYLPNYGGVLNASSFKVAGNLSVNSTVLYFSNSTANVIVVNNYISGNGAGLTSVTSTFVANSGIVSNASGIFVNANTGLVANSFGLFATGSQIQKLDSIAGSFNSACTIFNLTVSSSAVFPGSPQNLIVVLGGVQQEPGTVYTVSGSQITFTTAPPTSETCYIIMTGVASDTGVVGSNSQLIYNSSGVYSGTSGYTINSSGVLVGNGAGLTSVTATITANSGIVSNASGVFVNANTGLVANSSGLFTSNRIMINVMDYGADKTGNTSVDNSTAFTAALNALGTYGGIIYAPPGTYNFNTTCVFPVFAGGGACQVDFLLYGALLQTFNNISIFSRCPVSMAQQATWEECKICINGGCFFYSAGGYSTTPAILLSVTYGSVIRDTTIYGFGIGVQLGFALSTLLENVFTSCGNSGIVVQTAYGLWSNNASDVGSTQSNCTKLDKCHMSVNSGANSGVTVLGSDGVAIQDCIIEGGSGALYSIIWDNQDASGFYNFIIENIHLEHPPSTAYIKIASGLYQAQNIYIKGLVVSDAGTLFDLSTLNASTMIILEDVPNVGQLSTNQGGALVSNTWHKEQVSFLVNNFGFNNAVNQLGSNHTPNFLDPVFWQGNSSNVPQNLINIGSEIISSWDVPANGMVIESPLLHIGSVLSNSIVDIRGRFTVNAAATTANLFQVANSSAVPFAINSSGVAVGNGAGLTSVPGGSVTANYGIVSNASGVFVNANTGLVANSSGLFATGVANVSTITSNTYVNRSGAPTLGMMMIITDANVISGSVTVGGGNNVVMTWYNGSNWRVLLD